MQTGRLLKKRFWLFLLFTVIAYLFMRYLSHQLPGKSVIDFEMAKTVSIAQGLVAAWGESGTDRFLASTYGDFLFIIGYAGMFFYGCRYFGKLSGNDLLQKAGKFFSILAIITAITDLMENCCMIYTIKIGWVSWLIHLTYDLARIKFSLIFIVVIYMVICMLFWGIDQLSQSNKKSKFL